MNGINLNDLPELAKKNPKYASMFGSLKAIDTKIKEYAKDIVEQRASNPPAVYIKTELMGQCFNLYLFSTETKLTVGTIWPLVDFLEKCEKQTIEYDVQERIIKMLVRLGKPKTRRTDTDKIIWI